MAADDDKTQGSETPPGHGMAAMEKAMQEALAPGEQHAFLGRLVGDWTYTSTLWMDPSQPPMKEVQSMKIEYVREE